MGLTRGNSQSIQITT